MDRTKNRYWRYIEMAGVSTLLLVAISLLAVPALGQASAPNYTPTPPPPPPPSPSPFVPPPVKTPPPPTVAQQTPVESPSPSPSPTLAPTPTATGPSPAVSPRAPGSPSPSPTCPCPEEPPLWAKPVTYIAWWLILVPIWVILMIVFYLIGRRSASSESE